jgi:hypothetical protein
MMTFPLSHLSNRSLTRAIKREKRASSLNPDRENGGMNRHDDRLGALIGEANARPAAKHQWTLSAGDTIREWRESHGIGPSLATLTKRVRRAGQQCQQAEFRLQQAALKAESDRADALRLLVHARQAMATATSALKLRMSRSVKTDQEPKEETTKS